VFKEKHLFAITSNSTLNTMVSLVLLVIVCTARIACRRTDTQTHTQDNYSNLVTLAAYAYWGFTSVVI